MACKLAIYRNNEHILSGRCLNNAVGKRQSKKDRLPRKAVDSTSLVIVAPLPRSATASTTINCVPWIITKTIMRRS